MPTHRARMSLDLTNTLQLCRSQIHCGPSQSYYQAHSSWGGSKDENGLGYNRATELNLEQDPNERGTYINHSITSINI